MYIMNRQRYEFEIDRGTTVHKGFRFGTMTDSVKTYDLTETDSYVVKFRNQDYSYGLEVELVSGPEGVWAFEMTPAETAAFPPHRAMYFVMDRTRGEEIHRMLEGPVRVRPAGGYHE